MLTTNHSRTGRRRSGFTLVELLVVIVIIAILMALLIPAITSAVRTAKNAAVSSEIEALSQALAQFKNQYGDYPPSKVFLNEGGGYASGNPLHARSIRFMKKFFGRARFNLGAGTTQADAVTNNIYTAATGWHDFNGNGVLDAVPYTLQGHECLTFFLGGIPAVDNPGSAAAVAQGFSGFASNPVNPFQNSVITTNRTQPLFEFRGDRLIDDMVDADHIPGYVDSLGNQITTTDYSTGIYGFYVYFSAYGSEGYDPSDTDFETIGVAFKSTSPVWAAVNTLYPALYPAATTANGVNVSPGPNPYTVSRSAPVNLLSPIPTKFHKPSSFQIISPGADRVYGMGGEFNGNADDALPVFDPAFPDSRRPEDDNITSLATGGMKK